VLAKEDFNDDKKDAGEIGAGHTVTALYEIVPAGKQLLALNKPVDALKYQPAPAVPPTAPRPRLERAPADGQAELLPRFVPPASPPKPERAPQDAKPYLLAERGVAEVALDAPVATKQKAALSTELLTLKLRYKAADGDASKLLEFPLTDAGAKWEQSSRDFRFAAAVASYGMLLRDSPHKGEATWSSTLELGVEGKGEDASGYRAEFLVLVEKAKALAQ